MINKSFVVVILTLLSATAMSAPTDSALFDHRTPAAVVSYKCVQDGASKKYPQAWDLKVNAIPGGKFQVEDSLHDDVLYSKGKGKWVSKFYSDSQGTGILFEIFPDDRSKASLVGYSFQNTQDQSASYFSCILM